MGVAEVNVGPLWRGRGEVVVVIVGGWVGRVSAADTTLLRQMAASGISKMQLGLRPNVTVRTAFCCFNQSASAALTSLCSSLL